MANVIKPFPTTSNGDPEVLPWATGGTTLEPTTGQESNGWQPQAVAGPPDYRLENYARLKQSQLNDRGVQSALFLERCQAQITLAGYNAGVNQRRITINGTNFDVTDGGGSLNVVRDSFVAAINSSVVVSPLVTAAAGAAGILTVTDNTPGNSYSAAPSLAVSVLAGAGTITISSAGTTPIVREDDAGLLADLVVGSTQANADAVANHHNRIIWRKAKGSFRAGRFIGTEADLANTGDNSVALGNGATASGADSHAYGLNASASGLSATALGASTIASGITSTAIGNGSEANQTNALALQGAVASGNGSVSVAAGSTASGTTSLAMMGGSATATRSIAIGSGSSATATNAIAIGSNVSATTNVGAFASGASDGTLRATGIGSRAHGFAGNSRTLEATGNGASATGYTSASGGGVPNIRATGDGSFVHGFNVNSSVGVELLASGINARAIGSGALASADYAAATGYGAKAANRGEEAQAATVFDDGVAPFPSLQRGSAQKGSIHVALRTTDATADQVMTPGAGAVSFTPLADTVYLMDCQVAAKEENADDSYATWSFKLTLAYVAGVLTIKRVVCINGVPPAIANIVPTTNAITHFDDGATAGAAWVLKVDINAGALRFKATGAIGKNIRWSARADYVCVGQKV